MAEPQSTIIDRRFSSIGELCRVLVNQYWRTPVVFRNPFGCDLLGASEEIVAALRERSRQQEAPWGVYTDHRSRSEPLGKAAHDEQHWFAQDDSSIKAYVDRLSRFHRSENVTIVVDGLQAANEAIWFRCARFLTGLYGQVGLPFEASKLYLFAGRYATTPFGFHKDSDINVTCIVEGRKRYLIWPYDAVAKRFGMDEAGRYTFKHIAGFDYTTLESEAIVIDAQAGDVVYWPYDAWHVIESYGQFSVSLNVGAIPFASPLSWITGEIRDIHSPLGPTCFALGEQPDRAASRLNAVRRALSDQQVLDRLREKLLYRRTRFGFAEPIPRTRAPAPSAHQRLAAPVPGLVAWLRDSRGLLVSANGHGFRIEDDAELVELLKECSHGGVVTVGELEAKYCARGRLARERLYVVLQELLAMRALTPAQPIPTALRWRVGGDGRLS